MPIAIPPQAAGCIAILNREGFSAHVVGGCVRDCLMGRTPADWDICTSARPEQVQALFGESRVIPTGLKHGTVTLMAGEMPLEVTTLRRDGLYEDHRRPSEVTFSQDLQEDLARRDFTVNAMAYHPEQGLTDPFGGQADLAAKVLRCVGDPGLRFEEDALRILRLFRFAAQLGFAPEEATLAAAGERAALLGHVSAERIAAELNKLLLGQAVLEALCLATDLGVLEVILPEIRPAIGFAQHKINHIYPVDRHLFHGVAAAVPRLNVRLAMLFHDIGKPDVFFLGEDREGHCPSHAAASAAHAAVVLRRLRYPTKLAREVEQLVALHSHKLPVDKKALRRLCGELGIDFVRELSYVKEADDLSKAEFKKAQAATYREVRRLLDEMEAQGDPLGLEALAVRGDDLLALGIPCGPRIGEVLSELLSWVLDEPSRNTREALLEHAKAL